MLAVPDAGGLSLTGTTGSSEVSLLSIDATLAAASLLPGGGRLALGTAGRRGCAARGGGRGRAQWRHGRRVAFGDRGVGDPSMTRRRVSAGSGTPTAAGLGYGRGGTCSPSGRRARASGWTSPGGRACARAATLGRALVFEDGTVSDRAFMGMANDDQVGNFGLGSAGA